MICIDWVESRLRIFFRTRMRRLCSETFFAFGTHGFMICFWLRKGLDSSTLYQSGEGDEQLIGLGQPDCERMSADHNE